MSARKMTVQERDAAAHRAKCDKKVRRERARAAKLEKACGVAHAQLLRAIARLISAEREATEQNLRVERLVNIWHR